MAADMQRKRSSDGPDGTLAPSDGQSMERAESPTPGMTQGMEPGTCSGQLQPTNSWSDHSGYGSGVGTPHHSFLLCPHLHMCSAPCQLFVRCGGSCRKLSPTHIWSSSPLPSYALCLPAPSLLFSSLLKRYMLGFPQVHTS